MKEVIRFKCDFCQKLAARSETIEKHETVCLKNPNGKNCYMCEMAYQDDYENYNGYHTTVVKDQCMCIYTEEVISAVLGGADGNLALKCDMFHRAEDGYWYRSQEDAEKNLQKYEIE